MDVDGVIHETIIGLSVLRQRILGYFGPAVQKIYKLKIVSAPEK
jgi:hypothetical protein